MGVLQVERVESRSDLSPSASNPRCKARHHPVRSTRSERRQHSGKFQCLYGPARKNFLVLNQGIWWLFVQHSSRAAQLNEKTLRLRKISVKSLRVLICLHWCSHSLLQPRSRRIETDTFIATPAKMERRKQNALGKLLLLTSMPHSSVNNKNNSRFLEHVFTVSYILFLWKWKHFKTSIGIMGTCYPLIVILWANKTRSHI